MSVLCPTKVSCGCLCVRPNGHEGDCKCSWKFCEVCDQAGRKFYEIKTHKYSAVSKHLYRVNLTVEILAEAIDEKDLLSKLEKHIDAFTDIHSLERFDINAIDKEG